jgi:hypothetical protein
MDAISSNLMVYTSGFFLINVAVCYIYEYYVYSALFFILFVTSIIYHTHYTDTSYIVDKVAIFAVLFYGAYMFYLKLEKPISLYHLVAVITFLGTIMLYYLGYDTGQYCFDCDKTTADFYHGFLHFICCVGHVCIVII